MAIIKIYVSEEEKEKLREYARLSGQSLSSYIQSLLHPAHQLGYLPSENQKIMRNKYVFVRVSDEEYAQIKKNAGCRSLSSYARSLLLSGGHPICITIRTDDIMELDENVSAHLRHFQNTIEALAYRKVLLPQETEKMLSILQDIRDDIKEVARTARNNRKSIRSAGLRWLKEKYRKETEEFI